MPLRNLPTDEPRALADLVRCRPGQVSSRLLTRADDAACLVLLAFSAGESVSEETYVADTLYHVLEGRARVDLPDREVALAAGEALLVPAGVPHAVAAPCDLKLLQVSVP